MMFQTTKFTCSHPPLPFTTGFWKTIIMDNYIDNYYNLLLIYSKNAFEIAWLPNKNIILIFLKHLHCEFAPHEPYLFLSNNEEDIVEISRKTEIMVDPVYNVKLIRGMLHEMETNPGRFKGHRILYIHTGEYNLSKSSFDKYVLPSLWLRAHIPCK